MNGRAFGQVLCALVILIAGYELLAIRTSLPTISRILQGWRDAPGSNLPVWVAVIVILTIINLFSAWLFHHLLFEVRSTL